MYAGDAPVTPTMIDTTLAAEIARTAPYANRDATGEYTGDVDA